MRTFKTMLKVEEVTVQRNPKFISSIHRMFVNMNLKKNVYNNSKFSLENSDIQNYNYKTVVEREKEREKIC